MKLYTSTKEKISKIIREVSCNECRSGQTQPCDIIFPQASMSDYQLQQMRLVTVHNKRKHAWKLHNKEKAKKDIEEYSNTFAAGFVPAAALRDIKDITEDQVTLIDVIPDRRVSTDRRKYDCNDRRQRDAKVGVDQRLFGRDRRSGGDRRAKSVVLFDPFEEKVNSHPADEHPCDMCNAVRYDATNKTVFCHVCGRVPIVPADYMAYHQEAPAIDASARLDDYQRWTDTVAIYEGRSTLYGLNYATLGLIGESGEFADKLKKILRVKESRSMRFDIRTQFSNDEREELKLELGDALWYVARCAKELGFTLREIAMANIEKLESRKTRDTLHGSGDHR